jgi:dTDP-4-amino-4,6-dideoxygalactose transaminase
MGGMVVTNDHGLSERISKFSFECNKPGFFLTYGYVLKLLLYHLTMQPNVHRILRMIYEYMGKRNPLPIPVAAIELLGEMPEEYLKLFSNAQAHLAITQLNRLDQIIAHRQTISKIYHDIFNKNNIKTTIVDTESSPAFVRYPVWVKDRQKAILSMKHRAVLGTWFSSVLEEATHPKYGNYIMGSCPNAELAAQHLVNLPTHLRVTEQDAVELALLLSELAE